MLASVLCYAVTGVFQALLGSRRLLVHFSLNESLWDFIHNAPFEFQPSRRIIWQLVIAVPLINFIVQLTQQTWSNIWPIIIIKQFHLNKLLWPNKLLIDACVHKDNLESVIGFSSYLYTQFLSLLPVQCQSITPKRKHKCKELKGIHHFVLLQLALCTLLCPDQHNELQGGRH